MKIDMPEVLEGVAAAKCRLRNCTEHLEKTKDQSVPAIVKTMMNNFFGPSKFISRGLVVIYSLGTKDLVVGCLGEDRAGAGVKRHD